MTATLLLVALLQGMGGEHYITLNPAAAFSAINSPVTRGNAGLVSNLEYGLALGGGYSVHERMFLEVRLSAGPVNQVTRAYQVHSGIHYFLSAHLYAGGGVRTWDLHYVLVESHYLHFAPLVYSGYQLALANSFFFDTRLSQMLAVAALPAQRNATASWRWLPSPAPSFSPVLPVALLAVGYRF